MVIDVVSYNGEEELFDIRYNILKDVVDEFIVIEFDKTFSGHSKLGYFIKDYPKVKYFFIKEPQYQKYKELAESSPNTVGAEHWKTEFMQKESIKDCLTHLKNDDIVFIGDCDEIWNPDLLDSSWFHLFIEDDANIFKLRLDVYTYWLNNKSDEEFWGTVVTKYKRIKNSCLNHIRSNSHKIGGEPQGWHFTSLAVQLRKKLEDSYTRETYANDWVMSNLDSNIRDNRDFLGRNFQYKVDEADWPQYLKDNRKKYTRLLK